MMSKNRIEGGFYTYNKKRKKKEGDIEGDKLRNAGHTTINEVNGKKEILWAPCPHKVCRR